MIKSYPMNIPLISIHVGKGIANLPIWDVLGSWHFYTEANQENLVNYVFISWMMLDVVL